MAGITRGFGGRRTSDRFGVDLPPGQYLTEDFPVLSAGPTPRVATEEWEFVITTESEAVHRWTWAEMLALPSESVVVDLHCVTRWSKLGTTWTGISLDTLLADVETSADYALANCYGGYSTNLPLEDLIDGKAWIAYAFEGGALHPEHGGPARLLVPHLYFWKSAKWVRGIELREQNDPGFWETLGYHEYGDPWREQRHWGD